MKVSKKKAKEIILKAEKILILISGFVTPDGDSIGSSFGLKMILNKYYRKRVDIKSSFKIPQSFDFLQKAEGIYTVMHALEKVPKESPIEFHIFGGGRHLPDIALYAKQNREKFGYRILFHGYRQDILEKIRTLDIFVYWSVFDNMPNALLDALACGLPVVSNRHGAFAEILGEDNLLANNPEEFVTYVSQLAANPAKRKKYSKKNLDRSQHFLISNIIQQWIALLPK